MIMMTAYGDHETIETLRSLGAKECLIKPVSFDELLAAVERNLSGVEADVTGQSAVDVRPAPAVPVASPVADAPAILVVEDVFRFSLSA